MSQLTADSPVQYVKGVGPHRAECFAELGVRTVRDLLEYLPFRYQTDAGEVAVAELEPQTVATVRGEIVELGGRYPGGWAELSDGEESCRLRWFQQRFGGNRLFIGAKVVATGKVQLYDGIPELVQPNVRIVPEGLESRGSTPGARQVGVYRASAHLKSLTIRRAIHELLQAPQLPVDEVLPAHLRSRHDLLPRGDALRQVHEPADESAAARARRRLAYEELLLMEVAIALRRHKLLALQHGRPLALTPEIDQRIRARFPFALTPAQNEVIREITADFASGRPMTRLLQGDVGSGKTVVALYAALVAIAHGFQAAIMAPTEILAVQHAARIEQYLAASRVRRQLLRGGLGRKQRDDALTAIARGEIDLVVGTQALLQKDVAFQKLALVVVDEQHKFGVLQRASLRTKGPQPHYLVMTATPIPRTLAMTVFGDLDVSILKHSPPGRGKIITRVVTATQYGTVLKYVRQRLEAGERAYVVCPLIESDDPAAETAASAASGPPDCPEPAPAPSRAGRLRSAKEVHQRLTAGPWRGLNVGLLHGALPAAEKQATIEAFAEGNLHAVVATTVVEVGVDVPDATIMVIEHAERFGLSQLHQLRGRVGRGARDSLCVLIARGRNGPANERLRVMAETTDGFRIAEADLRQRGPGEFLGTRQHGLPDLRVASLIDDFELLELARQDAFEIVAGDPRLQQPEHRKMIPELRRMFGTKLVLIDAA